MPIDFQDLFKRITQGIALLAESSFKKFIKQAKSDGKKILTSMKTDLKKWTIQLANKEITPDDFRFLVLGQKDLLEMVALKEAGLALVEIDEFKNGVLNLIIDTIFSTVKI